MTVCALRSHPRKQPHTYSSARGKRFFFQAEDGIRDWSVTGVQTCALFISSRRRHTRLVSDWSSDVCSSDLADIEQVLPWVFDAILHDPLDECRIQITGDHGFSLVRFLVGLNRVRRKIGRASCRERV